MPLILFIQVVILLFLAYLTSTFAVNGFHPIQFTLCLLFSIVWAYGTGLVGIKLAKDDKQDAN